MASIWCQGPGTPPRKLQGYLDPKVARAALNHWADQLRMRNKAKMVAPAQPESDEVHLQWPDGQRFTVFIEWLSPPSAVEKGQPKRTKTS